VLRLVLAVLCLALAAACGGDNAKPQVGFTAGAASAKANPIQYCDQDLKQCAADPAAVVKLAVPRATPVQVSVPEEVALTPWSVVFTYVNAAGERIDGRSPVIAAGKQRDFTLALPAATDQLVRAEVQQVAAGLLADPGGGVSFPIRASWALVAATS
jgi:hypothetical protein